MKKNENLDSKLQILTPNQEIFKNPRFFCSFFHFFIIFFSFSLPVAPENTWNLGKPWKTMENPSKTKENEKKDVANEKTMKLQMKKMKFDGKRWWTKMKKMKMK